MVPISLGMKLLGLGRKFWYLLPILALVIALQVVRGKLEDRTRERNNLQAWQALVVTTTRSAAKRPKLGVDYVPAQIAALGRGVGKLQEGLRTCSGTAKAAAENDRLRQARAAAELAVLEKRDAARADLIGRLQASAGRPRPPAPAGACPPSDVSPTLKGVWR